MAIASTPIKQDYRKIIGKNIRFHRIMAGMSQEMLGQCIGVTFQQIQKYERGQNNVSAGRLKSIAIALNVQVDVFFEADEIANAHVDADKVDRMALRMSKLYSQIESPEIRKSLYAFLKILANDNSVDKED